MVFFRESRQGEVRKLNIFADTGFKKLKECSDESTQSFCNFVSNLKPNQLDDINARSFLSLSRAIDGLANEHLTRLSFAFLHFM